MRSKFFEAKTNVEDINSSSTDNEEEGAEYKVSGASAVQKQSLADVLQNRCQACNFIKKIIKTAVLQRNL